MNPRHLEWKTKTENRRDSIEHGTSIRTRYGSKGKLTPEQVQEIRSLRGIKTTCEIGDMFGVTASTISHVMTGLTHSRPSKVNHFTEAEVEMIREFGAKNMTYSEMGRRMGRSCCSVSRRAKAIGINSGYAGSAPNPTSKPLLTRAEIIAAAQAITHID